MCNIYKKRYVKDTYHICVVTTDRQLSNAEKQKKKSILYFIFSSVEHHSLLKVNVRVIILLIVNCNNGKVDFLS